MVEKRIKVAIIDSGYENETYDGVFMCLVNDNVVFEKDVTDKLGHGTIVTNIIKDNIENVDFFIVKLFNDEEEISEELLNCALEYLEKNIKPDIINMSIGLTFCNDIEKLFSNCQKLKDSGSILVAAFDNNGAMSYPAAFDNVIGVDSDISCVSIKEHYYLENSPINIRAMGSIMRLKGRQGRMINVQGSSFATPYITVKIIRYMQEEGRRSFESILNMLKKEAVKVIVTPSNIEVELPFKINRAITFPYNKEIETLLMNDSSIEFDVCGIYDIKYMKNIGRKIYFKGKEIDIQSYKKINWDDEFDTLILGHTKEIEEFISDKIIRDIINNAKVHKKRIYSFDARNEENIFTPVISEKNVPYKNGGKLYQINKPILAVAGTSSKQGKFSLQMMIKRNLEEKGCKVGHLSTEPSGYLVGADYVFPMGYNSSVFFTTAEDYILMTNYMMKKIEEKKSDIIISGLQSQTVPMQYANVRDMVVCNHYLLLALNPDAIILCINMVDTYDYIEKTIRYLESIVQCKVIAIVIFPMKKEIYWNVLGNMYNEEKEEVIESKRSEIEDYFKINTYILGRGEDELCKTCIDFFC